MSHWGQLSFQDAGTFFKEYVIFYHDYIIIVVLVLFSLIMYLIIIFFKIKLLYVNFRESHLMELVWTIFPVFILICLAVPSFYLLYSLDVNKYSVITLKITGYQWFWFYEYSDFYEICFNSYILVDSSVEPMFIGLDTDNWVVLPANESIRLLVSSGDVIHSWAIPALGVKVDAIPGRINEWNIEINFSGCFFGQCSEICGVNHSFMPISLERICVSDFIMWLNKNLYL